MCAIAPYGVSRVGDRKSTRLNSSHSSISYAVFCSKNTKDVLYASHLQESTPEPHRAERGQRENRNEIGYGVHGERRGPAPVVHAPAAHGESADGAGDTRHGQHRLRAHAL